MRLRRGVTLVELAVAVVILSLAMLATLRAFDAARVSVGGQVARLLAHEIALNRAAELRLLPGTDLPPRVRQGRIDWDITVEETATEGGRLRATIHVTAPGQPGASVVAYVRARP